MKKLLLILSIMLCTLANAQFTKLYDFAGEADGGDPNGSLISDGTFLYGMTSLGGTTVFSPCLGGCGFVYKIKLDGTGYDTLFDFKGAQNGSQPLGSLYSDGTFLYGMTTKGGTSTNCSGGCGVVFKIKPDGTGYSLLHDLLGNNTNGCNPRGSLISDGTFLYGVTSYCGGVLFRIKPDGTGYVNLFNFSSTNGIQARGSLISDGTFFYGTTSSGGANTNGVIFKIKPDGTGYTKLYNFANDPDGNMPDGSLILSGGFLYGMTSYGGTNGLGTIFKIKSDGTGYIKLFDFAGFANGSKPRSGSLISDGTFLYGTTGEGGANNKGVIFKIKSDGTGYVDLYDFGSIATDGDTPNNSLFLSGGFLYGTTVGGGANNYGTVFKFHPAGMGIAENNSEIDCTIYPNPTSGLFNMQMSNPSIGGSKMSTVKIYDVYGESVYETTWQLNKTTIDLRNQSNGIYFLHIKTEHGTAVKKIIINK